MASTPASMPWPSSLTSKNWRGAAIRSPSRPSRSCAEKSGAGSALQVESSGSGPAIPCSSNAASSTVRVKGPIWSSELAKAISP